MMTKYEAGQALEEFLALKGKLVAYVMEKTQELAPPLRARGCKGWLTMDESGAVYFTSDFDGGRTHMADLVGAELAKIVWFHIMVQV